MTDAHVRLPIRWRAIESMESDTFVSVSMILLSSPPAMLLSAFFWPWESIFASSSFLFSFFLLSIFLLFFFFFFFIRYSPLSDVWSWGVTMWEIVNYGAVPYRTVKPAELRRHIVENGLRLKKLA